MFFSLARIGVLSSTRTAQNAYKAAAAAAAAARSTGCWGEQWPVKRQQLLCRTSSTLNQNKATIPTERPAAAVGAADMYKATRSNYTLSDKDDSAILPFSAFLTDTFGRQHS